MKKIIKSVLCACLTAALLTTCFTPIAADMPMQGVFGDNLTWRYTPSDNTLTVEGQGGMASRLLWEFNYFGTKTPWEARGLSDKIRRAVIAEGVTSIGSASFQYCRALQQVQLPDSLQAIGDCAFQGTALTEICIPKNVEVIGDSAFADCANLVSVVIDSRSTMEIGAFAFGDTPFMQNAQYDRNGLLILNGHLLSARKDLEGVCTIPEGVTDIADYAFYDYYPEMSERDSAKITKAVFPKSLQYIGSYAFQGCSNLREVRIKGEEVRFGYSPFSETAMPDEQIEAYTAAWPDEPVEAPAPTEFLIGAEDKAYAYFSFENTEGLQYGVIDRLERYVVAPANPYYKAVDGVLYSKDGTILLRYPGGRTDDTFTVPQGVKVIGARAFQRQGGSSKTGPRKVILPEGVTVIRESAFDNCENLEEIVLPSTLKTIDACAFCYNASLKEILLPEGLQEIGECFLSGSKITHIRIPDSVESIRGGAFAGSTLQTIEGFSRVPFRGEYGMERETLVVEEIDGQPPIEQDTQDTYEAAQNDFTVCDAEGNPTTEEYVKVSFFGSYRKKQVQLHAQSDLADGVHLEWRSDNKKVTVDENGLVTNKLHKKSAVTITVSAVDGDGNVLLEKQVLLFYYRFNFQLKGLRKKAAG